MYLSEKHQIIYFGPCKAASSTVIMTLECFYKAKGVNAPKEKTQEDKSWPISAHHSIFLPEEYKDLYKFTTCRNPYTRELSKYNFLSYRHATAPKIARLTAERTFEEHIEWVCSGDLKNDYKFDLWSRSQKDIIFGQPVYSNCIPVTVDRILKTENLIEEFETLPFYIEDTNTILKARNNFARYPRQTYFPKKLINKFYEHFKEDFEFFQYDKEPPEYEVYASEEIKTVRTKNISPNVGTKYVTTNLDSDTIQQLEAINTIKLL